MHRLVCCVSLLCTLLTADTFSQTDSSRFSFFPPRLGMAPFLANPEEARIGLQQELGSSSLKIGVGAALDAIEYASGSDTIRWGPDFYVFALSNEIKNVLFKIAAADGYFGMHLTYANGSRWSVRFRAIHQSAHQVDGNYDADTKSWAAGREPFNYSRNYGELNAAYGTSLGQFPLRLYAGFSYAVWIRPREIKPFSAVAGIEIALPGRPSFYLAYNLALTGIPAYVCSNTIEAGMKLGEWKGRGVRLFFNYFSGLDTFGAFYNLRKEYVGAGFTFDLW